MNYMGLYRGRWRDELVYGFNFSNRIFPARGDRTAYENTRWQCYPQRQTKEEVVICLKS